MTQVVRQIRDYLSIPTEQRDRILRYVWIGIAGFLFVLVSTLTIAFDSIFSSFGNVGNIEIGQIASESIVAPRAKTYTSTILTEQAKQAAYDSVGSIYDPPDPNVARQQTIQAQKILEFMSNIRLDSYATHAQKVDDIQNITALQLDPVIIDSILSIGNDDWTDIQNEVLNVLPRVMRETIRESDQATFLTQLPTQVSIRFEDLERDIVVSIVEDLIRPNTFINPEATEAERQEAVNAIAPVERSFERGQIIVTEGEGISELVYEALDQMDLLLADDFRMSQVIRAVIASIVVLVMSGLYIARFERFLIVREPRMLILTAVLFLIILIGAQFLGIKGSIYLYPASALGLILITIAGPHTSIIASLSLAFLIGIMGNGSLEYTVFVAASGLIAALTLRNPSRLNNFFYSGGMVAIMSIGIISVFNLGDTTSSNSGMLTIFLIAFLNGALLTPAFALALMYAISTLFNLPTPLKLLDLSHPNKPLLQRLLREAPGTYQHSLQVSNLAEQAATAIDADAELIRVGALYHDIGKILNPVYFTENQQDIANPHDTLNDPYRSADIIIGHVTEGDEMAKQYKLPNRIRDFIREHHGTTEVYVFYQRAIQLAGGNPDAVDIKSFRYPGPKPRSKETAILMLADSCEAAVRSVKPQNRKEITELVAGIFESKRKQLQLDECNLTLQELKQIQDVYIDILQSVFHPRINYQEGVANAVVKPTTSRMAPVVNKTEVDEKRKTQHKQTVSIPAVEVKEKVPNSPRPLAVEDDDNTPLSEVPTLPRKQNGKNEFNDSKEMAAVKKELEEANDKEADNDMQETEDA
ncbi:HD family phosphohydrolase [Anaerolineales bacterium]